jgi:hypothetical protein
MTGHLQASLQEIERLEAIGRQLEKKVRHLSYAIVVLLGVIVVLALWWALKKK